MSSGRRISIALVGLVLLAVIGWLVKDLTSSGNHNNGSGNRPAAVADATGGRQSGLSVQPLSGLPAQAAQTYQLIRAGGPFPYPTHDGVIFDNREHRLPTESAGYYHEYTVPTPGAKDRGTRRLITGAGHELYYTGDHYQTFVVVDPGR